MRRYICRNPALLRPGDHFRVAAQPRHDVRFELGIAALEADRPADDRRQEPATRAHRNDPVHEVARAEKDLVTTVLLRIAAALHVVGGDHRAVGNGSGGEVAHPARIVPQLYGVEHAAPGIDDGVRDPRREFGIPGDGDDLAEGDVGGRDDKEPIVTTS
jgi:hypothetical protein